ncbi:hypothetical protein HDU86_001591 [Geranomyces michiganensis]|nr:hypothetical protein HDU86_001591 [Geranomyces michiganensis]
MSVGQAISFGYLPDSDTSGAGLGSGSGAGLLATTTAQGQSTILPAGATANTSGAANRPTGGSQHSAPMVAVPMAAGAADFRLPAGFRLPNIVMERLPQEEIDEDDVYGTLGPNSTSNQAIEVFMRQQQNLSTPPQATADSDQQG